MVSNIIISFSEYNTIKNRYLILIKLTRILSRSRMFIYCQNYVEGFRSCTQLHIEANESAIPYPDMGEHKRQIA